jgi:mono/diheme cytochrome c family protein
MPLAPALVLLPLLVPGEEDVRALLPEAQTVRRIDVSWPEEEVRAFALAVGRAEGPEPAFEFYDVEATIDGKAAKARAGLVPVKGEWGAMRVAVATDEKGTVTRIRVLGDSKNVSEDSFLSQFVGRWAPVQIGPNSRLPLSSLLEKVALAREGSGEEAEKLQTLLRLKEKMDGIQLRADGILGALDRADLRVAAAQSRNLSKEFADLGPLWKDFAPVFLDPKDLAGIQPLAEAARKACEQVAAAAEKDKADPKEVRNLYLQTVDRACGRCHGYDDHRLRKPLQKAIGEQRDALGIGQGFFLVGHDVVPAGPHTIEDSRAVALAIKEILLRLPQ